MVIDNVLLSTRQNTVARVAVDGGLQVEFSDALEDADEELTASPQTVETML